MAVELTTSTWCDECLSEGEHTPAGSTETVRVKQAGKQDVERVIDLCEPHHELLISALLQALAHGRDPARREQEWRQPGPTAKVAKIGRRFVCPKCSKSYTARVSLYTHYEKFHGSSSVLRSRAGYQPAACPECHREFAGSQGVALHMRRVHNLSPQEARDRARAAVAAQEAASKPNPDPRWPGGPSLQALYGGDRAVETEPVQTEDWQ